MKKIDPDKQILPRNGKGTLCRGIRLICTLFLLFAVSLPVYADKGTGRRFSLEIKNAYLSELFLQIEKSSNYSFVYADADIRALGKVSFKCTNATLTTILDRCLTKTDLEYKIDKNHVVISLRKGVATTAKAKEPEKTLFTVKGYVRDDKGQPVIGATVVQPNSNNAVITLTNGAYELATEANASLTFSYVGMKPQTVAINGRRIIDVVLLPDTEIGEVIISGYQTISRHQTTGAVNQIQMEDIKLGGNFSVDQMLSGQTPGVSITMTSGEPSAAPKIRIRGTSSILGNKAPLWVLDGVILDDPVQVNHQDLTGEDAAYLIGNAIGGVNPSDIETITILKDASATALYGTQATNGVIVVTTKRGSSGPTRIRYDGSFSVQERPSYSKMNLMNASQRIALSQEMLADNFTYTQIPDDIGYEALWLKYLRHGLTYDELTKEMNKMARRNTDWYDLLFNDSFSHNHTLSLSGGTDQVTYYASLGYNNTPTTAINGGSERYNANLKFGSWVTKKLYVGVNLLGSITKNKGYSSMAGINPNSYAYETARTIPAYNDDGTLFKYKLTNRRQVATDGTGPVTSAQEDIVYNILNEMNTTGARGNITNINAQLNVQYEIIKGLKYELLGSIVHNNTKQFDYAMASSAYVSRLRGWNLGSSILSGEYTDTDWYQKSPIPLGGILSGQYNTSTTYTLRNTLRYSTVLAQDHTISAMAVSEIRSNPVKGSSATWYGWQPDRGLTIAPVVTNQFISDYQNGKHNPTLIDNEVHYVSWLGSVSYSYKDKWTINGNIRADGSNLFGDNPEYRFLPGWSVGAKYTMSNGWQRATC